MSYGGSGTRFQRAGMDDKVRLLETSGSLYTYYYTLGDTVDYYYGNLLPSTGYIKLFDIVKYYDGLLLRIPEPRESRSIGRCCEAGEDAGRL